MSGRLAISDVRRRPRARVRLPRITAGTVKLSRICPFCGRILLDQRLRINDLAVAAGGENAAKLLNLTVPSPLLDPHLRVHAVPKPLQAQILVLSSSVGAWQTWPMKRDTLSYHGYRFPPDIISHAVWLYHRFGVSFRDVEDLLAQRGITVSYEAIRLWCLTFGSVYARRLKRRQGRLGDIWHLDEVFVTIQGQRRYLWRAVDQDGDVIDILVQSRRDCRAATRFFRKLLKGQERTPGRLVTDKLSSYRAAHRAVMLSVAHRTDRYENNRAEVSHQPTRQRERQMRRFKSPGQAQRFLSVHGLVRNLFRVGRHLVRAVHHRELRGRSFLIWDAVTIAA